jgi:hypothetical protein
MEPKERAAARRLTIYQHLARQVGRKLSSDLNYELARHLTRFCHDTNEKATIIDGYHVWCEIHDIPLKDEGLGSLFADSIPTADEKLRQLFAEVQLEEYRLMMQREESFHKKEQETIREYLSTRGEE